MHINQSFFKNIRSDTELLRFPLLVENKENFIKHFAKEGYEIGGWFSSAVSCTKNDDSSNYYYKEGTCKNSEIISKHIVNIPLSKRINDNEIKKLYNILKNYILINNREIQYSRKHFNF